MTTAEIERKLAERYGRGAAGRGRRTVWILGGTLAAAAVGYIAWATVSAAMGQVDYDTTGYEHVDDRTVAVSFQVTTPRPDTPFACALEAQDTEHGVVGWRVVEYAAEPAHTRRFTETVPTTAPATTGFVTSCWIP